MKNYIKILLIIIFFSSCSYSDKKKHSSDSSKELYFNHNILKKNYIGMTRKQIIYMFGMPVIADSFNDVYHYYLDEKNSDDFQKKMLNLYFKNDKVLNFNFK